MDICAGAIIAFAHRHASHAAVLARERDLSAIRLLTIERVCCRFPRMFRPTSGSARRIGLTPWGDHGFNPGTRTIRAPDQHLHPF
jgi:hypothetical protein